MIFRNGHPVDGSIIPDGEYEELTEFAVRHDIPVETVRMWHKRKQIPSVAYYGRIFIAKNCDLVTLKRHEKRL